MTSEFEAVRNNIIGDDACNHCGTCMSFCEWDKYERENPGSKGDKELCTSCMVCFNICPRVHARTQDIEKQLFGANRSNELLGHYVEIKAAKATDKARTAQDAGVTTALIRFMFREKMIDAALLVDKDARWVPQPFIATSEEEVSRAAGSKYTATPAASLLKSAIEKYERIAFVGEPCQINAIRNLQKRNDPRYPVGRIVFIFGLFCAESFAYGSDQMPGYSHFVEKEMGIPLEQVWRFDIKRNNLLAFSEDKSEERPLTEMKHLAWPMCFACTDFAAELADLSLGAVGSRNDENTLVIRSQKGANLVEKAVDAGIIQLGDIRNTAIVEKLTENKKERRAALSPEEIRFLTKQSIRGNLKKAETRG